MIFKKIIEDSIVVFECFGGKGESFYFSVNDDLNKMDAACVWYYVSGKSTTYDSSGNFVDTNESGSYSLSDSVRSIIPKGNYLVKIEEPIKYYCISNIDKSKVNCELKKLVAGQSVLVKTGKQVLLMDGEISLFEQDKDIVHPARVVVKHKPTEIFAKKDSTILIIK
jgi:hypothetical protein